MKQVTIYGERCSGTNYLEELLTSNFDVEIVWRYGWKHFFGFSDFANSDDILFIGIIRNLEDWINSLYRRKYHLPKQLTETIDTFLTAPFYSIDNGHEIMQDRNMDTGERYSNIFEMRLVKTKYLVDKMPTLVKHYCLITHDNLIDNFADVMHTLRAWLRIKPGVHFPLNVTYYMKDKKTVYAKKKNDIPSEKIHVDSDELKMYEAMLFPRALFPRNDGDHAGCRTHIARAAK